MPRPPWLGSGRQHAGDGTHASVQRQGTIELHQLHYFVAVAEMGSFSRAAQRCNVSQPSLSQQIIKLEHELGQRLFERLGRSVLLTAAGQALLPQAQRIPFFCKARLNLNSRPSACSSGCPRAVVMLCQVESIS